jgi:hypothetical protein
MKQAGLTNRDATDRLKRQLQELISMRAARLVSDDEFAQQREIIRKQLSVLEATRVEDRCPPPTETELAELSNVLTDLESTWSTLTTEARRGFSDLLLPTGYVFQRVRTAEKGLLFKTFEPSENKVKYLVPLIRANLNTICADIRKLLALVRGVVKTEKKAA